MSDNKDSRIVQMQFDNRQFEKGIETSTKSLDNLKKGLNLDSQAKSLANLEKAGKSFSLAGIERGVDALASKFSAMGVIGITTIANLTNSAINAGKRIVSALTIDPVKTGLSEYETKMNSIKTILANTSANGTTLDDVNAALADLNEYSDKTIYNFAQMTDMVGKFAAKSGELDSSVSIVKGMANLAAQSGVDNTRLQGALYQMSQMAETVQAMDWMSIDTAGLSTVKFKDDLLAMAQAMGTIDPKTLKAINDGTKSFKETLKDDWLTKDVFSAVTNMYALDESMTKAAGEVTTFTKLFDVMKESVQSGWALSWENIIGNKDESTRLLGAINEAFSKVTGASADARNEMLSFWKANGGRQAVIEGIGYALINLSKAIEPIKAAFRSVFPAMTGEKLVEISKRFKELMMGFKIGNDTAINLHNTFEGLFSVIDIGIKAFTFIVKSVGLFVRALLPAGSGVLSLAGGIGDFITNIDKAIESNNLMIKGLEKVGIAAEFVGKVVKGGIGIVISLFRQASDEIKPAVAQSTIFADIMDRIRGVCSKVGEALSWVVDSIGETETAFAATKDGVDGVTTKAEKATTIFDNLSKVFVNIKDHVVAIADSIKKTLSPVIDWISDKLKGISLGDVGAILSGIGLIKVAASMRSFAGVVDSFKGVLGEVGETLKSFRKTSKPTELLKIAAALGILAVAIIAISFVKVEDIVKGLGALGFALAGLVAGLVVMNKMIKDIKKISGQLIALGVAMLTLALAVKVLASVPAEQLMQATLAMGALMMVIAVFVKLTNEGDMKKSSKGMVGFATGIAILAGSLAILANMNKDALIQGGIAIAALVTLIGAFVVLTKGSDLKKSSKGMVGFATGIAILTGSLVILGNMNFDNLMQGGVAIAALITLIGAFINVTSASDMKKSSQGMVAFSTGLLILTGALSILGKMNFGELMQGGLAIYALLNIIGLFIKSTKEGELKKSASGLIAFSAGLAVMSVALKILGSMNTGKLIQGTVAIAALMNVIALFIKFTNEGELKKSASGLIAFSSGLLIMAAAVGVLSMVDSSKLTGAVTALGVMILLIAAFIKVTKGGDLAKSASGMMSFAIGFAVLAGTLAILSALNTNKLIAASGAMSALVVGMATFIKFTSGVGGGLKKALVIIIEMTAILTAITAMFLILNTLPLESTLGIATSLSTVLLALSATMFVISKIPVAGAGQGVAGLAIVVAGITAILAALGGLNQIPGFSWLLNEGSKVLGQIGNAIGNFVGSIIGGFMGGISSSFPKIGADLGAFMTNAKPFIEGVREIDARAMDGVLALAETVLILTAADILNGLTSWFTGGSSMVDFGKELADFAPYFNQYYESIKGIDGTVVEASANAAKAMAEFANNIPNSGGLVAKFTGENSISQFADELMYFGPKLKAYGDSVKGLDGNIVLNSANAAKAMAEMAKEIPNTGGLVSFFTGDNNMSAFGDELVSFGPKLKAYGDSVKGLDSAVVENSVTAGKALTELAKTIPNTGGLVSFFTGDNDMSDFGNELAAFGPTLKAYADSVKGLDSNVVTNSANACKALTALADTVPNTGGLVSFFSGDNDMATFGDDLSEFGGSLYKYYTSIQGINFTQLGGVITQVNGLVDMAKGISDVDFYSLSDFSFGLKELAKIGINDFIQTFNNSVSDTIIAGNALVNGVISGVTSGTKQFKTEAETLLDNFNQGIVSQEEPLKTSMSTLIGKLLATITTKHDQFVGMGKFVVSGLVAGMEAKVKEASNASTNVATAVLHASKKRFDINSPSKEFFTQGMYCMSGLTNAFEKYTPKATETVSGMADTVINTLGSDENLSLAGEMGKGLINSFSSTVSDGSTTVADATKQVTDATKTSTETTKSSTEATKENTKAKKDNAKATEDNTKATEDNAKAIDDAYNKSVSRMDDLKYYDKLSLANELKRWETLRTKYKDNAEKLKEIDKEIYRVKNEIADKDFEDAKTRIDDLKDYDQMSLYEEYQAWLEIQSKYDNSTKESAAKRKEADKQVYNLHKELLAQQKSLDDDYYANVKDINDKAIEDIKALNDAFDQEYQSRMQSIYDSYKLFDKVEVPETTTSGWELLSNLDGQVKAIEEWGKALDTLEGRGIIHSDLMAELRAMGPESLQQIQALNQLTDTDLDKYVTLWAIKQQEAGTQAAIALETTKKETDEKIAQITINSNKELAALKLSWQTATNELTGNTGKQLDTLKTTVTTKTSDIVTVATNKMKTVGSAITSLDWAGIGSNIVDGMISGIQSRSDALAQTAAAVASSALKTTKKVLGIHSPSRAFAEVGMYADQGFANGLLKYAGLVSTATDKVSNSSIDALKQSIAIAAESVNSTDAVPVIRPVLDLTNITNGVSSMNSLFGNRSLNVGVAADKASKAMSNNQVKDTQSSTNQNGSALGNGGIQLNQYNYSPKALSRMDIYRNTRAQLTTLKGLV